MPIAEQREIAARVKAATVQGSSASNVVDEALERVRMEWQDRGYWQVQVTGEATTVSSNPVSKRIRISVHVEEGFQYRLQEITFKNNKILTNSEALRSLFPIKDGDLLNREQITKGLESVKTAYASRGFINFTSIPEPNYDDSAKVVSLVIDVDEGKQFFVRNISVLGVSEAERQEILDGFLLKPGQLYNERLFRLSMEQNASRFPECPCGTGQALHLDEKNGIVDLTLDFRPCS